MAQIGYIVGSLAESSINRKLMHAVTTIGAEFDGEPSLQFSEIGIADLDHYDHERDDDYPPEAQALKRKILDSDGIIIATPEYNRSIPGVLKNAIDWASRPYGDNAFAGKPVAIIGASVGAPGTSMAQQHLRNILAYLDAPTLGQPEAFVHYTDERFDDDGEVIDVSTREFLRDWLEAFRVWMETIGAGTIGADR